MRNQATRLSNCPAERLARCRGMAGNAVDQLQDEPSGISQHLPEDCRQRLAAEGKSYAKSNCAVCGQFSPRWKECDAVLAAGMQPEVLAVVAQTDSIFPETQVDHRDAIELAPVGTELIDRAHVNRLNAKVSALQQRLNIADQRVCNIELQLTTERARADVAVADCNEAERELSRALIRLKHAKPLLHSGGFNLAADDIGSFLASQSAPAAKMCDCNQGRLPCACNVHESCARDAEAALSEENWHMNPCKQGHRDVGACGGKAFCHTCDETITATTTQEAFEQWNATHPANPQ
jgi:hypothetical protein